MYNGSYNVYYVKLNVANANYFIYPSYSYSSLIFSISFYTQASQNAFPYSWV